MPELFLFERDSEYIGFTPTLFNVNFNGDQYRPAIISRSAIDLTDNTSKSPITITFDSLNSFANSLLQSTSELPVLLTIFKDGNIYWTGQVLNISRKSFTTIEISCDSTYTVATKAGSRYRINLHCNKRIYSAQCGVNPFLWAVSSVVPITADSNILSIPNINKPNGYFSGGIVTLFNQTRDIVEHTGDIISIGSPFNGKLIGVATLFPGCALTEAACIGFNNIENGLMFARLPSTNPFGTQGLL